MRLLLLLTAALAAAPCRAQLALPEAGLQSWRDGAAALAKSKKAAAPAALSDKDRQSLDRLVDRLIKDGTPVEHAAGVLHAFQKTETASNMQRQVTVGLVEIAGDPNEGLIAGDPDGGGPVYRDLVERHTYSRLEAQVMLVTVNADGTAALDSRVYIVSLDGRVMEATLQTGSGKVSKGGVVEIDGAKLKTTKLLPAAVKPDWDKLLPELLKMSRVIEA